MNYREKDLINVLNNTLDFLRDNPKDSSWVEEWSAEKFFVEKLTRKMVIIDKSCDSWKAVLVEPKR
jgi:hypothetical protein